MTLPFHSLYRHGFLRVAVGVPLVQVANPAFNAAHTLSLAHLASQQHAALALFPELGLSSYTSDDLFHQDALLDQVRSEIGHLVAASRELTPVLLVGAPLRFDGRLFNCAVVIFQ